MLSKLISSLSQTGNDGKPEFYTHIINSLWKLGIMPLVSNLAQLRNGILYEALIQEMSGSKSTPVKGP